MKDGGHSIKSKSSDTMDNKDCKPLDSAYLSDSDSSSYLKDTEKESSIDLGGLFPNRFTNIKPLYTSPNGATQVYTATRYGKRFVLKGLKETYQNDPIFNLAMAKEFEIGIGLEHPNIRRTISLETVDGIGKVIVLEYIDGRPLESMLQNKEIGELQGRSICSQIADALEYLHGRQAMHRDLKPANILVTYHGDMVKLIDFNLADKDEFIILKNPAGSGKYIAPEQREKGARPTPEADIYSLGVVAGEIAKLSGDRLLASAAEKCQAEDPSKRMVGFRLLKEGLKRKSAKMFLNDILSSAWLTYILASVCTVLAAFIAYNKLF